MKKIIDYADIFYNKRFIVEKEMKINELLGKPNTVIEVDAFEEISENE